MPPRATAETAGGWVSSARRSGSRQSERFRAIDIERSFGLDPLDEGPLAMCGFGHRTNMRIEAEFDPLNAVWAAESPGPRQDSRAGRG
jgi:hypothetical protein